MREGLSFEVRDAGWKLIDIHNKALHSTLSPEEIRLVAEKLQDIAQELDSERRDYWTQRRLEASQEHFS